MHRNTLPMEHKFINGIQQQQQETKRCTKEYTEFLHVYNIYSMNILGIYLWSIQHVHAAFKVKRMSRNSRSSYINNLWL